MNWTQAQHHVLSRVGTDRVYGTQITPREVDRMIERARQAVVEKALRDGQGDLAVQSAEVDSVAGTTSYTINNVLAVAEMAVKYTADGPRRRARDMGAAWNRATTTDESFFTGTQSDPVFRRLGKSTFEVYPAPVSAVTGAIRVDYVRDFPAFVAYTDDLGLPEHYCWQVVDLAEAYLRQRMGINERQADAGAGS